VTIAEEHARYLRALVEATPVGNRAARLVEAMRELRASQWDASELSLRGVFEITSAALAEREALLDGLILLLREAMRLRRGAEGLIELARQEGERRPRAWNAPLNLNPVRCQITLCKV
jgi:hypothetical protein